MKNMSKSLILTILLLNFLLFISCGEEGNEDEPELSGIAITGRIINELTGEPIPNVTVNLSGAETAQQNTGSDGIYRFDNLTVGTYSISVNHPGFVPNSVEISIQSLEVAEGDLALSPIAPIQINPTILDFSTAIQTLELAITNTGGSPINYEIQFSGSWIELSKSQGVLQSQNSDLITVTVNRSSLDAGNHQSNLIFNVPGQGSQTVQVLATKLDPTAAVLVLNEGVLNFGSSIDKRTIVITNEGDNTLLWEASVTEPWISLNQTDGSLPPNNVQELDVFVSRQGISDGDYSGRIDFSSNGGGGSVSVQMDVSSTPTNPTGELVVTSGLRLYYTFDEYESGGIVSDSHGEFLGFSIGNLSSSDNTPTSNGSSIEFQDNGFISVSSNPIRNTNSGIIHGTINLWINSTLGGTLFSLPIEESDTKGEFTCAILSSNHLVHSIRKERDACCDDIGFFDLNNQELLLDGSWHMVTLSYDGASRQVSLYVDGIRFAEEQYLIYGELSSNIPRIGSSYQEQITDVMPGTDLTLDLYTYTGLLDNVRVYNRPLSASEVEEIFQAKQ